MTIEDVVREFEKGYAHWELTIPPESVTAREQGGFVNKGWTIFFKFGVENDVEYMDYYASHRMTNDRHERLYADGRSRGLPTYQEMHRVVESEEENERITQDFYAYNRVVGELLAEKGFTSPNAHASHNVNSWLLQTPPEERDEAESSE